MDSDEIFKIELQKALAEKVDISSGCIVNKNQLAVTVMRALQICPVSCDAIVTGNHIMRGPSDIDV
jgi:hypothetical protein